MDTAENQVATVDAAAEAEVRVANAENAVTSAQAEHKTAVDNHKLAKTYSTAMAAALKAAVGTDNEAAARASATEAEQTMDGWKAAVDTAKASVDAAKAEVKAAKAALKEAKKVTKPAKEVVERVEQNGQRKPSPGTSSDKLWNVYDSVAATLGRAPALEDVMAEARKTGIVDGTIKAAYAHWRKFHGVTGRVVSQAKLNAAEEAAKTKAEAAARKAEEKARKDQEKADQAAAKAAASAPAPAPEMAAPAPELNG